MLLDELVVHSFGDVSNVHFKFAWPILQYWLLSLQLLHFLLGKLEVALCELGLLAQIIFTHSVGVETTWSR